MGVVGVVPDKLAVVVARVAVIPEVQVATLRVVEVAPEATVVARRGVVAVGTVHPILLDKAG